MGDNNRVKKPRRDFTKEVSAGMRFGRWLVLEDAGEYDSMGHAARLCRCDCGKERMVRLDGLCTGDSKSCGCLSLEMCTARLIKYNKSRALPDGESSFNTTYNSYVLSAKDRGLSFELTREDVRVITSQRCVYCGGEPSYRKNAYMPRNGDYVCNGIDRVDNTKGYTIDNCVPCCRTCNLAKSNTTLTEFRAWVARVYDHMFGA